ncbi:MAG TPA: hypothetical protein VF721_15785 [Pyrinomonadaceae bacterium]|jgi:hypothetical protein
MSKNIILLSIVVLIAIPAILVWQGKTSLKNAEPESSSPDGREVIAVAEKTVNDNAGKPSLNLSEEEKKSLHKLVPQTVRWFGTWSLDSDCYKNEVEDAGDFRTFGETGEDFRSLVKRFAGKQVTAKIEAETYRVKVYLVEMKTRIDFNRSDGRRLAANRPERLCSIPDRVQSYQSESYFIPNDNSSGEKNTAEQQSEKRLLLDDIVAKIQADVCSLNDTAAAYSGNLTIAGFEPGDPEIYALLKNNQSKSAAEKSIYWMSLKYNEAEIIKSFGRPDEITELSKIIERTAVLRKRISCVNP